MLWYFFIRIGGVDTMVAIPATTSSDANAKALEKYGTGVNITFVGDRAGVIANGRDPDTAISFATGAPMPDPATTEEPPDPFKELTGTKAGREALFERQIEPQLRGASGFLRRGLERGFQPTQQAFLLQGALAQPEDALNFAQFLPALGTGTGRRVPTAGGIQTQIMELLQRLQLPMDDPNELVLGARTFAQDPGQQFQTALAGSQRFRQILPFLRAGFEAEAGRRFGLRQLDAPGENLLSGFAQRGFRF